jgi:hypothetical protein
MRSWQQEKAADTEKRIAKVVVDLYPGLRGLEKGMHM